jgi:hypothetical protein
VDLREELQARPGDHCRFERQLGAGGQQAPPYLRGVDIGAYSIPVLPALSRGQTTEGLDDRRAARDHYASVRGEGRAALTRATEQPTGTP